MTPAPKPPALASPLRIWNDSAALDPASLEPGRDLVLHAPRRHGEELPAYVLLDDWLPLDERERVDREARRRLAAWRERRDAQLTVAGVCLPWVHELELYTDVFLRETRVLEGIRAAVAAGGEPERAELRGLDPGLGDAVGSLLASEARDRGQPPRYPLTFARPPRRLAGAVRETIGVPPLVRGGVLVEPYWHLLPLWQRLEPAPVAPPENLPAVPVSALARGGWIRHPGAAARRRSRAQVAEALGRLEGSLPDDPLERLLDRRALAFLAAMAGDTLALVAARRDGFRRGSLKAALVPSDTAPLPRMAMLAAREAGAPVVLVQHGILGHLPRDDGRPARVLDGWEADRVAVWSEHDEAALGPHVPGEVVVTGNPGAPMPSDVTPAAPRRTLVLGQMPTPLSTGADVRVTWRHLRATLGALETTRPGTDVMIRPHPLDRERETYERVATDYPELRVEVRADGGIEDAIRSADLCVGALSTATLQAAALGTRSILLDATGLPLSWPFDGSGDFPTARSREELERELAAGGERIKGREAALTALGSRPDAVERVVELVREAAG